MRHPLILSVSKRSGCRHLVEQLAQLDFAVQNYCDGLSWEVLSSVCPDVLICDPDQWQSLGPLAPMLFNRRSDLPDLRLVFLSGFAGAEAAFQRPEFIYLDDPPDIFLIHDLLTESFPSLRRQSPRLEVNLPGMLHQGMRFHLGQILNLSCGGLFFLGGSELPQGETFSINIPLWGLKTELELTGRIVFQMQPERSNNYRDGVGIQFTTLSPGQGVILENYLRGMLKCPEVDQLQQMPGL